MSHLPGVDSDDDEPHMVDVLDGGGIEMHQLPSSSSASSASSSTSSSSMPVHTTVEVKEEEHADQPTTARDAPMSWGQRLLRRIRAMPVIAHHFEPYPMHILCIVVIAVVYQVRCVAGRLAIHELLAS